ncbi:MAG: hypothetical protein ACRCY8_00960 [Dermatophilaceae bacterium]
MTLDLAVAVARAPAPERAALAEALRTGRTGLSGAKVDAEVSLDESGRLCHLDVVIPAGTSPHFDTGEYWADRLQLWFEDFGAEVEVPTPHISIRGSVEEFLRGVVIEEDDTTPW